MRTTAQILLLATAHVATLVVAPTTESGLVKVATAAVLAGLALWLPMAVADGWFEFRHEVRFGRDPLPVGQFLVGSLTSAAMVVTGLVAISGIVAVLISRTVLWSLLLALMVVAGHGLVARIDGRLAELTHPGDRLDPIEAEPFIELAERAGVSGVEFGCMRSDDVPGLNAMTTGAGQRRRILVTSELMKADGRLRDHVVGHELAHLRFGHLRSSATASAAAAAFVFLGLGLLVELNPPVGWLGLADLTDQRAGVVLFGAAALLALGISPWRAWQARVFERSADRFALQLTEPVPLPLLRELHVTERADLEPGRWARWLGVHPPPAERLEVASRVGERPPNMRAKERDTTKRS